MSFFNIFPTLLALYLIWSSGLKSSSIAEEMPSQYLKGCEDSPSLLEMLTWQANLREMSVAILIAIITSGALLASSGKTVVATALLLTGFILFEAVRHLINKWKNHNPFLEVRFLKIRLSRDLWLKCISTIIVLISLVFIVYSSSSP